MYNYVIISSTGITSLLKKEDSNNFADTSSRAREIKERINKRDYIKLKSFCIAKENIIKMKRELTIWENAFASDTSDKGLISKIYV